MRPQAGAVAGVLLLCLLAGVATVAGAPGAGGLLQEQIDPDDVVMDVTLRTDGDARSDDATDATAADGQSDATQPDDGTAADGDSTDSTAADEGQTVDESGAGPAGA